jgi:hypothetical protein
LSNPEVEPPQTQKLKPPYGPVKSYSDFFDLCERLKIEKVDTEFLRTHGISSEGNEYKAVLGLRFLGLLNEDGTVTGKMKNLNVEGEPFQKALDNIIREAYKGLFDTVKDLEKAKPQDIINCFRGDPYAMSPTMAREATKIFVFLAQKAGIPLSQEIVNDLSVPPERMNIEREQKKEGKPKEPRRDEHKHGEGKAGENYVLIPDGMIRIEYQNKVLMFLPEGDKKTRQLVAKMARQFIETYEAENSEEKVSIGS